MGYTHYWTWKNTKPVTLDPQAVKLMKHVISYAKTHGVRIEDDSTNDEVYFNGVDEDAHEDFVLPVHNLVPFAANKWSTPGFNFCKTAEKPYDVVVTACLIILNHYHGKDVEIASDGYLKDWVAGKELVMDACRVRMTVPPKVVSK